MSMTRVVLRPHIVFASGVPAAAELAAIHSEAHHRCYIANSVKTAISIEPRDGA
jgi:organic hydroperoxide reductase OsmC/OhrA